MIEHMFNTYKVLSLVPSTWREKIKKKKKSKVPTNHKSEGSLWQVASQPSCSCASWAPMGQEGKRARACRYPAWFSYCQRLRQSQQRGREHTWSGWTSQKAIYFAALPALEEQARIPGLQLSISLGDNDGRVIRTNRALSVPCALGAPC